MSQAIKSLLFALNLKTIAVTFGLMLTPVLSAETTCTETVISNQTYASDANKNLTDQCGFTFGPNAIVSSGAQLNVSAPVIRLLPDTRIYSAATVNLKAENIPLGGINQAILGPLSGSEIKVYRLSGLHTPIEGPIQADTSLTDLSAAGTFRLALVGIAENEWILVTATGGQDIDADDNGQIDPQPTANQGTIHALATAADWRAGGLKVNVLTEMGWQYTHSLIGQVAEEDLPIRLNQLAELWIKQDINADGKIDWHDLLSFNPNELEQQAKLNFNYQDLFTIRADSLSIIAALHQNNSDSLETLLDIQFGANLTQNPTVDDNYTKVALQVMIFGQGQVVGETGTGVNLNSTTGSHSQTVYLEKDATKILTLTASPTAETRIINWQGCDYVTVDLSECQIAMDKGHSILASFAYKTVELKGAVHDLSQASNILTADQVDVTIGAGLTDLISQLAQATTGDFIVGSTGSGFLRKITAINVLDSLHYLFTTSEASLEDVINQGTAVLQKQLVNSDLQGYTPATTPQAQAKISASTFKGLAGIKLLPAKNPDDKSFTLRFGQQQRLAAIAGNSSETITETVTLFDDGQGGTITATGEIILQISIDADVDIGWTGLDSFKYLTQIDTTESLQFNLDASADFNNEILIGTLQFKRIKFVIGIVPVWITPKIELFIGMNGDIVTTATTGIEFRQSLTGGVLYADDKFSSIKGFTHDWTVTYPQATVQANTKGWIKAVPSFKIYDGIGPEMPMESYLKLNASASLHSEQCQQSILTASLSAGVLVDFTWDLQGGTKFGQFLHLDQLEEAASFNIYQKDWAIKKWALESSPCTVPPFMNIEGSGIQVALSESQLVTQETTLGLSVEGNVPVNWQAIYQQDGIVSVTPSSGTLNPATSYAVKIQVDSAQLPLGKYRNEVSFINLSNMGTVAETGNKSLPVHIEVQADVLTAPVLISGSSPQTGTAQLQWSFDPSVASAPLTEYYIFSSTSPSDPNSWILQKIVPINNNSATITGLSGGTDIYFSIEAHGNGRETPASNIISVTIQGEITYLGLKLNDTGITFGATSSTNNSTCTGDTISAQDCSQGRDATHNDNSDGHAGFSFTKLDSAGNPLSVSATNWSCVKDNVTGLIWEVKTDNGGLRDKDWGYTWYNSTGINDGGSEGVDNGGNCFDRNHCDTEKFVQQVNSQVLCGKNDWRMPTIKELENIVNFNSIGPSIDTDYFPHTRSSFFWSASPNTGGSNYAWYVSFYPGSSGNYTKGYSLSVRLVRKGQWF